MNVLVLGGTRMMGRHLLTELLARGHNVSLANRGRTPDDFGSSVHRITLDRTDEKSLKEALSHRHFDVVFDSLAYCSNDIRRLIPQLSCGKYVYISSTAVYRKHWDTKEPEFDPLTEPAIWGDRPDFPYDEGKRQAERALFQSFPYLPATAARFPFVIGEDDYTRRLTFYIEHTLRDAPMQIDDLDAQMAFVRSDEAGKFLAFLGEQPAQGAINGASPGTISLREILDYVTEKTGKRPVFSDSGDPAPYNGEGDYSINTDRAEQLGYRFSPLKDWIFALLDSEIATLQTTQTQK